MITTSILNLSGTMQTIKEHYHNRFIITTTPCWRLHEIQLIAIRSAQTHKLRYSGIYMITAVEINNGADGKIVLLFKTEEECSYYFLKYGNELDV